MAFCRTCGSEILAEAEICPKCGVRQKVYGARQKTNTHKSIGIAALLSFIWPGLGQIYNGQLQKGILFIVIQIVNFLLFALIIGIITYPAFWLYGMYDASAIAEKINSGEEVTQKIF